MAYANNPRWAYNEEALEPLIIPVREADSQSFLVGQVVYASGGYATAAASDAVLALGIAEAAATNVTSAWTTIPVVVFRPSDVFKMKVLSGTPSDANRFIAYALDVTSNVCTLDTGDGSHDFASIIKVEYDPAGTATGWVYVKFPSTVCQYQTGA